MRFISEVNVDPENVEDRKTAVLATPHSFNVNGVFRLSFITHVNYRFISDRTMDSSIYYARIYGGNAIVRCSNGAYCKAGDRKMVPLPLPFRVISNYGDFTNSYNGVSCVINYSSYNEHVRIVMTYLRVWLRFISERLN